VLARKRMYILQLKPDPLPHPFIYKTLSFSLTLMNKGGTLELERQRLGEEIEGRKEEEEGEELQHLPMDLNNILSPLMLEIGLLMEDPSCMEKVMGGRACMMELKKAWVEERWDLQPLAMEALKSQS